MPTTVRSVIEELKTLLEEKYIHASDYKYKGKNRKWIHMVYKDNERHEFKKNGGGRTTKINAPVSASSFNPRRVIAPGMVGGGRKGYVFHGKPTHHFPFDAHSARRQQGQKRITKRKPDEKRYHGEHDEAWLNPSKNKVTGHVYRSDARTKAEFGKDKAGVKFLHRSSGDAYAHLNDGKIHKLDRGELTKWHAKHFPDHKG